MGRLVQHSAPRCCLWQDICLARAMQALLHSRRTLLLLSVRYLGSRSNIVPPAYPLPDAPARQRASGRSNTYTACAHHHLKARLRCLPCLPAAREEHACLYGERRMLPSPMAKPKAKKAGGGTQHESSEERQTPRRGVSRHNGRTCATQLRSHALNAANLRHLSRSSQGQRGITNITPWHKQTAHVAQRRGSKRQTSLLRHIPITRCRMAWRAP